LTKNGNLDIIKLSSGEQEYIGRKTV